MKEKQKNKTYVSAIDLKTAYACDRLYSRLVWQKLFDLYRNNGGDVAYMDNLLCDLYSLERYFKAGSFVVFWYFCNGHTVMQDFVDSNETCYRIEFNADDMSVVIVGCTQ